MGVQCQVDCQRRRRHQQRVAVGCRARHRTGGDIAAGAGTVLDHDALAEARLDLMRNQPRQGVGDPSGRESDEEGDGACRVLLRLRLAKAKNQCEQRQGAGGAAAKPGFSHVHFPQGLNFGGGFFHPPGAATRKPAADMRLLNAAAAKSPSRL